MQRPPFRPTVHHRMAAFEQAPLTFIAQFTQAVGSSASLTPSASACDRSKRRRFGCRRTAKLRELTCGGCLSAAPWRGASYDARRRLLRAEVAPKDSLREAFGDADSGHVFSPRFLSCNKKGGRLPGRNPGICAKRRGPTLAATRSLPPGRKQTQPTAS